MIELEGLTKRFGEKLAVDGLSFVAEPGRVTGFLGPNGAGKSTSMRMMVGLDRPTSGLVRVNGRRYVEHRAPLQEVGALLEARSVHPGRSARNHLLAMGRPSGIGRRRVDEVIDMVGLTDVAGRRAGAFSLGMGQRLGVAAALLGDPETLILDEPVNGLDLDGIRWIRALLRRLAGEGRTVFLSSHLMSEMAVTADRVVVVGKGRLLRDQDMADFVSETTRETVSVRTPQPDRLAPALRRRGAVLTIESPPGSVTGRDGGAGEATMRVDGLSAREIGDTAAGLGVPLWELAPQAGSLEEAYLALTRDAIDYRDRSHSDLSLAGPPPTGADHGGAPPAAGAPLDSAPLGGGVR